MRADQLIALLAVAIFEAVLGICRKRHTSVEEAEEDVREFLEVAGIELIPITAKEAKPPPTGCRQSSFRPPPGQFVRMGASS